METIGVQDAKTHLSGLIKRVGQGEEFVVTRSGYPVARLVPYTRQESINLADTLREIAQLRSSISDTGGLLNPGETLKDLGLEGLE